MRGGHERVYSVTCTPPRFDVAVHTGVLGSPAVCQNASLVYIPIATGPYVLTMACTSS
jgi:hypothetical protein